MAIIDISNLIMIEIIFNFSLFIGILYLVLNIKDYFWKKRIKRKEVNS